MAIVLVSMLVLAECVSTMGFALLKVLSPALPQETLRHVPPPVARQEHDPHAEMMAQQRELALLDKELRDARQRIQELEREAQPGPGRILALIRQQDQLTHLIEQGRASLREYEDAARRQAAQQEAARQRLEGLRAEAAELERRIAALQASVGQTQEARRTRAALEGRSAQNVECVRGAVILQPQHTRIPVAELRSGRFVTAVTGRGASFLVRPDGMDSFLAARAIARAAGVTIGYEPVLSGSKP
jgi:predicted  nucleic acid-binding Zn-ribbon protein